MNLNLDKKFIVVSGGASGIGEAIVRCLNKENAVTIIVDKNEKAAEELCSDLDNAHYIYADLSNAEGCKAAVDKIKDITSELYGLVNNAGRNDGIGLEEGSLEAFENSLKNNLNHYYHLAHLCLPMLKKQSSSAIVNISSKTAVTGQGGTSAYVAAKAAQLGLTREWAVELLAYKIRVNAVIPAEVMTPMYNDWLNTMPNPELELKKIEDSIPLDKRMTTPQEIANMVTFLLSDKASHITGQHIFVDGGYSHLDRRIK